MNIRLRRNIVRVVAVLGLAATLGGCVVAPYPYAPGYYAPAYYRPHYYRYY